MLQVKDVVDVLIIGGGPVGLFGATCAGLHGMSTTVIEALPELGGQPMALYPEKYIYDVAGFPKILAKDLIANLIEQAERFNPTFCTNERALELYGNIDQGFSVVTDRSIHRARTVVCTVGLGAFTPRRHDAPGVEAFEGKGVYYYVPRLGDLANQRILIVGGGDAAVDWALALEPIAQSITLIHRRGTFRALQKSVDVLMESRVDVRLFHDLCAVEGDEKVRRAVVRDSREGTQTSLEVDAVILSLGFTPDLGPVATWNMELADGHICVDSRGESSVAGIFAAGDAVTYPGKLRLIAGGFGEVATAVAGAKRYVDPDARVQIHSSNMSL